MEHPFFATSTTRAEAMRWLTIAEKLLSARDLVGSKSFATRARDSDPTLSHAEQILAVADTLLAGDVRIGNNHHDWYSILRLTPSQGRDGDYVATQYRNLALILNPQQNKFPFADQAFRLVIDAWSVLSNPSMKAMYDKEIAFFTQQQQQQQHRQEEAFGGSVPMAQNFMFFGGGNSSSGGEPSHFQQVPQVQQVQAQHPRSYMSFTSGSNIAFGNSSMSRSNLNVEPEFGGDNVTFSSGANQEQVNMNKQKAHVDNSSNNYDMNHDNHDSNVDERGEEDEELERNDLEEEERLDEPVNVYGGSTFWTACPYCYYMYEYPSMYVDCTLKCQNCKRAFQGVVIPSPPPTTGGQDYFCCWGFMPLGFSMDHWEKNKSATPSWTPFSPMFNCPQMGGMNSVKRRGRGRPSSGPKVYVDDDEVFVEVSDMDDSDDDHDWRNGGGKKNRRKSTNGKGSGGTPNKTRKTAQTDKGENVNVQDAQAPAADNVEMQNKTAVEASEKAPTPVNATTPTKATSEPNKKVAPVSARKQPSRGAKNFGKLDLNIECSNETEEPAARRMNPGHGLGRRDDENIEGNGFFEGLDEFLSSLPILSVVGEDKAVKAA